MTLGKAFTSSISAVSFAIMAALSTTTPAMAADHGDAPALAQDLGSDINDVFIFLDPTDITQTVLIATVHGFLVPGAVPNFAVFDENIKYRFEIFNDHVNATSPVLNPTATAAQKAAFLRTVKANRTIDITFNKRLVGSAPQPGPVGAQDVPTNLRRPLRQEAIVTLTGFTGLSGKVFKADANGFPLQVTPFNTSTTAPNFDVRTIKVSPTTNIQFFAGEVDDPFFFDLPAFNAFLDTIRLGSPNGGSFARARDTFAGYNTLAIAIRIPTTLLLSPKGPIVGMDFVTQRHAIETHTATGVKGSGAFKTVDRMGNPVINSVLIPFDKRNIYNSSSARGDVLKQFAPIITQTLNELGLVSEPPEASFTALASIAIAHGDILKLNTTISNLGSPPGVGYPNGRRLQDDTVDIILTTINHSNTLGDNVNLGSFLTPTFPFFAKPNQPLPLGSGTDDATRN